MPRKHQGVPVACKESAPQAVHRQHDHGAWRSISQHMSPVLSASCVICERTAIAANSGSNNGFIELLSQLQALRPDRCCLPMMQRNLCLSSQLAALHYVPYKSGVYCIAELSIQKLKAPLSSDDMVSLFWITVCAITDRSKMMAS